MASRYWSGGVLAAEQQELLGILGPLRSDIVEVETSATGTPLPDAYRNAPESDADVLLYASNTEVRDPFE